MNTYNITKKSLSNTISLFRFYIQTVSHHTPVHSKNGIRYPHPPEGGEEALETAAVFSYLAARRELYASWEHSGLLTLETSAADTACPNALSAALVNRYLTVKRSGRF
jgi:hypothetical protein